jgi:uncharacterized glyoxalase superfamily protein PhnB
MADTYNVDATYQRAIKAGVISGVKDPAGNTWWIATQVAQP